MASSELRAVPPEVSAVVPLSRARESARTGGAARGEGRPYAPGLADGVFIVFTLCILQTAGGRMLDDPGLGWNLRIADQIWEDRGFLYRERFCFPSEGRPWVTQAWVGDILLRLAYGWGGLNGLAVFSALCIALTLRLLFARMTRDGIPRLAAGFWTYLAALGTSPAWVTRPNLFTFPALVGVVDLCERYRRGAIPARTTLWLLPIFALWPNLHGGFLAGLLVLGVTYLVEGATALLAPEPGRRRAARLRLRWWTALGAGVLAATLLNPYGIGLHSWTLRMLRDPFIQAQSTAEWLPPNFRDRGWFRVEALVLLFPALAVLSRRRVDALALALGVVFLHFGLTSARYTPLWVVVATPTLAALAAGVPWVRAVTVRLKAAAAPAPGEGRAPGPGRPRCLASVAFAGALLLASPGMGRLAGHDQALMPSRALDRLLAEYHGERVFHDANWGGYLTWHGWGLRPRFRTWIDDRLDVHGRGHTAGYRALLAALPGWEEVLGRSRVDLLCIPTDSPLARHARASGRWRPLHEDGRVAIFRRATPSGEVARAAEAPP